MNEEKQSATAHAHEKAMRVEGFGPTS